MNINTPPDTKPGSYYVSMIDGPRVALLAGPFVNDHPAALAAVPQAQRIAEKLDPRAHWYAFGTCRLDPGSAKLGILHTMGQMPTPQVNA